MLLEKWIDFNYDDDGYTPVAGDQHGGVLLGYDSVVGDALVFTGMSIPHPERCFDDLTLSHRRFRPVFIPHVLRPFDGVVYFRDGPCFYDVSHCGHVLSTHRIVALPRRLVLPGDQYRQWDKVHCRGGLVTIVGFHPLTGTPIVTPSGIPLGPANQQLQLWRSTKIIFGDEGAQDNEWCSPEVWLMDRKFFTYSCELNPRLVQLSWFLLTEE